MSCFLERLKLLLHAKLSLLCVCDALWIGIIGQEEPGDSKLVLIKPISIKMGASLPFSPLH